MTKNREQDEVVKEAKQRRGRKEAARQKKQREAVKENKGGFPSFSLADLLFWRR